MSVEPGFGGQFFQRRTLAKIAELQRITPTLERPLDISVDGGVTTEIAPLAIHQGVTVLVAGTAIFRSQHPRTVIEKLRAGTA